MSDTANESLRQAALDYHEFPKPGKLEIRATKPLANGRDLARAYSPGVAEACLEIKADPANAARYTARGNLVAVVTNGTAVLGLGNIGALASKPVMEGKAVLFKKFANIDCFDIEVNESDPEKLAEIVCALEPTFGAINLEDIKAPDCFIVEKLCRERMNIPVFHDDQHGTAIVVGAAATNALRVAGKAFEDIKIVSHRRRRGGHRLPQHAGEAGREAREHLALRHSRAGLRGPRRGHEPAEGGLCPGVRPAHAGRRDRRRGPVPRPLRARRADARDGGAHGRRARSSSRWPTPRPRSCPTPRARWRPMRSSPRARSDFPNQVNNVLCFPFIFRGALDVGATEINDEMQIACVEGIAALARATTSAEAAAAYQGEQLTFGADYLIPKPFDPRLSGVVSTAVAQAAMESRRGHPPARRSRGLPRRQLDASVFKSALLMRPVFEAAATAARRIVFAEGEDERVLRAAQAILEETTDKPILIGRPEVIETRCERFGLTDPAGPRFRDREPRERPALPRLLGDLSPRSWRGAA